MIKIDLPDHFLGDSTIDKLLNVFLLWTGRRRTHQQMPGCNVRANYVLKRNREPRSEAHSCSFSMKIEANFPAHNAKVPTPASI